MSPNQKHDVSTGVEETLRFDKNSINSITIYSQKANK